MAPSSVLVNLLWCRRATSAAPRSTSCVSCSGCTEVAPDDRAPAVRRCPRFRRRPPRPGRRRFDAASPALVDGRRRGVRPSLAEAHVAAAAASATSTSSTTAAARAARGRRGPIVLTVHDLQYRDLRSTSRRSGAATSSVRCRDRSRRADVVAVPSAFVARHGGRRLRGRPRPDRRGAARRRRTGRRRSRRRRRAPAALRPRRRRVLVYPAITHPHKRHDFLVELLAGPWADPDLAARAARRARRGRRRR